jgi:SAM-dependent methyltransferase
MSSRSSNPRLDPPKTMPTYAVRAPLARWLRDEARRAHDDLGTYRLLDVGCGQKPYEPFFAPYVASYVGVDPVDNPRAELKGTVEDLPVADGSFGVVLCSQVLEHCDDPARAIAELYRATAPGGRLLLSTHGVQVYHPSPADYWRWTHAGLEKVLRDNGEWASVRVSPASGTTACVAMLVNMYIDLAARRAHVGALAKPVVGALNALAEAIDGRSARLREPGPGTLHANFHVVAEKAR